MFKNDDADFLAGQRQEAKTSVAQSRTPPSDETIATLARQVRVVGEEGHGFPAGAVAEVSPDGHVVQCRVFEWYFARCNPVLLQQLMAACTLVGSALTLPPSRHHYSLPNEHMVVPEIFSLSWGDRRCGKN